MTLPFSSATLLSFASNAPPPNRDQQRSIRLLPSSVTFASRAITQPPNELDALQSAIVLSTSTALDPWRRANPPILAKQGQVFCGAPQSKGAKEALWARPWELGAQMNMRACRRHTQS